MTTNTDRTIRPRGDRGEGVISIAIAVLIMALLGAAMWLSFHSIWSDTARTPRTRSTSSARRSGGG